MTLKVLRKTHTSKFRLAKKYNIIPYINELT